MKFVIPNTRLSIANALRMCGYHFEREHEKSNEVSAARNMGAGDFPRFHVYATLQKSSEPDPYGRKQDLNMNLHLDQKGASYNGASAHSGEYEGPLVEQEAARIKKVLADSQAQ
ncbi:MAG: hypothetical protein HYV65_00090 [Candidatus Spechtbacteria bacterium]|nr:hypothetical protein [Candidatus Spechtbacteria bacterium]